MEEKQTRALLKGKASFHRPRWPSLSLSHQTSRRIARSKLELAMKAFDSGMSSTIGGRMIRRQQVLMQGQSIERCNNLLDMVIVKSPAVDIIGTCMDPNPPQAEILGTCMH